MFFMKKDRVGINEKIEKIYSLITEKEKLKDTEILEIKGSLASVDNKNIAEIGGLRKEIFDIFAVFNRDIEGIKKDVIKEQGKREEFEKILEKALGESSANIQRFKTELSSLHDRVDSVNSKLMKTIDEAIQSVNKGIISLAGQNGNSVKEIEHIKKNIELIDRKILDEGIKNKNYMDGIVNVLRAEMNRALDTRIIGLLSENKKDFVVLQNRIDSIKTDLIGMVDIKLAQINKEAADAREKALSLKSALDLNNTKMVFFDKGMDELKRSNEKISSSIPEFSSLEKKIDTDVENMRNANALQIETISEKKASDYQGWLNQQFFEAFVKIIKFNKEMISKYVPPQNQNGELVKLEKEFEGKALDEKWNKEKELQGKKIINKGIAIIEERNRLHAEILLKEKNKEDVSVLKNRLSGFDWILREIQQ